MVKTFLIWISVLFCLTNSSCQESADPDKYDKLTNQLYKDFLFDPHSSKFLALKYLMPNCWGRYTPMQLLGWKAENDSAIYLIDKSFYLYPSECVYVHDTSFTAFIENDYLKTYKDTTDTFDRMRDYAIGKTTIHPLILAAWCESKDQMDLSKKILLKWKKDEPEAKADSSMLLWKENFQWSAFAGLVHHYMMRKDLIAERCAKQIEKLYPGVLLNYVQSPSIMAELVRRKKKGIFNTPPDSLPADYKKWNIHKKADFLIEKLDEVDERQSGQPGGVSLASDWRVRELIYLGDSVVPKLINVIEKDKRLTHSVHFWRDFSRSRTVLNVKEAALTAIMSIWQDPLFSPVSTGDNFTSRGDAQAKTLAAQLRIQLKSYAGKTLDVRKVQVLLDRKKEIYDRMEAAKHLANFGGEASYGTMVWTNRLEGNANKNPLIDKWKNPTIAEMIWEEYQFDLKKAQSAQSQGANNGSVAIDYLYSLIDLGDKRIIPTLKAAYAKEKDCTFKRKYAYACYWLGDKENWKDYCALVGQGRIPLSAIEYVTGSSIEYGNPGYQPGNADLRGILGDLKSIGDSISLNTIKIVSSPGHQYYKWIELRLLQITGGYDSDYNDSDIFYDSTFCLKILERNLDNKKPSDISLRYYNGSGMTAIMDWGGQSGFRMHKLWDKSDYSHGNDTTVRARICDMAASKLYHLIFGIPVCHVHMADKDKRIALQKAFLKRFTKFRDISSDEYNTVNELYNGTRFVPDLPRLNHPATEAEVNSGKAIFSMAGNKISNVGLPAWAIHKNDKGNKDCLKYLLVQAEYDNGGKLIYGAFTEDGPKVIKATDLIDIKVYKNR